MNLIYLLAIPFFIMLIFIKYFEKKIKYKKHIQIGKKEKIIGIILGILLFVIMHMLKEIKTYVLVTINITLFIYLILIFIVYLKEKK